MFKPETEWRPVAEPPDPLPEAASEALRDATVSLWRDLYQKVERYEAERDQLARIMDRVRDLLAQCPRSGQVRRLERQLARLRAGEVVHIGRPRTA